LKESSVVDLLLVVGVVLMVLWLLGLVGSYTLGGYVHVALVIGLILVAISLVTRVRGRRR
jgi:hypothetical protein